VRASRSLPTLAVVAFAALLAAGSARSDEAAWPYPPGTSDHEIVGLRTWLVVPEALHREKPASLVVVLHGNGGTGSGMAGSLREWADDGYVVCAPKSTGLGWVTPDVQRVLRIAAHLKSALPIDARRVHVVGFSNGGWNLAPLAFDDALRPCSATWVAAGFQGGSVPNWAKEGLAAIALAGSKDGNADAARATVPALQGKVRSVEARFQEGLDHAWPTELVPYLHWWMNVQEGRFTPGDDRSFDWGSDLPAALKSLEGKKRGGVFVFAFDPADAESADARSLQHEAFFDPEVRRLGSQLACVRLERSVAAETLAPLGITATPAVAVLDVHGAPKKVLTGKIKASALVKALRSVAPEKAPPRGGG
jgi:poly(3-hydroxybutyrate) depolymerase